MLKLTLENDMLAVLYFWEKTSRLLMQSAKTGLPVAALYCVWSTVTKSCWPVAESCIFTLLTTTSTGPGCTVTVAGPAGSTLLTSMCSWTFSNLWKLESNLHRCSSTLVTLAFRKKICKVKQMSIEGAVRVIFANQQNTYFPWYCTVHDIFSWKMARNDTFALILTIMIKIFSQQN